MTDLDIVDMRMWTIANITKTPRIQKAKQMVHCNSVKILLSMGEDETLKLWITVFQKKPMHTAFKRLEPHMRNCSNYYLEEKRNRKKKNAFIFTWLDLWSTYPTIGVNWAT